MVGPPSHEEESICILGERAGVGGGVVTRRAAHAPHEQDTLHERTAYLKSQRTISEKDYG